MLSFQPTSLLSGNSFIMKENENILNSSESYKAYMDSPYMSMKHDSYFHVYDYLFRKYKNKNITFVEVGILQGGSLFMWRKFFGPKARIIGIDLNEKAKKWSEYGFEIYIGSQSDEAFWQEIRHEIGPIDILLDDGGHTYDQQIITFESMIDNINDGGLLVVEDTHTSYMSGFGPKQFTFTNFCKEMLDNINQRFGGFNARYEEKRIWSMEVFESIIAFKVDRSLSNIKSTATENNGLSEDVHEYRYSDNVSIQIFKSLAKKFYYFKKYRILYSIFIKIQSHLATRNFKSKKFFGRN